MVTCPSLRKLINPLFLLQQKRLTSAAKKAIAKLPTRTVNKKVCVKEFPHVKKGRPCFDGLFIKNCISHSEHHEVVCLPISLVWRWNQEGCYCVSYRRLFYNKFVLAFSILANSLASNKNLRTSDLNIGTTLQINYI